MLPDHAEAILTDDELVRRLGLGDEVALAAAYDLSLIHI